MGLRVAIADVDDAALEKVGTELRSIHAKLPADVLGGASSHTAATADAPSVLVLRTDVSSAEEVVRLRDRVYETWGEVRGPIVVRAARARGLNAGCAARRSRCS